MKRTDIPIGLLPTTLLLVLAPSSAEAQYDVRIQTGSAGIRIQVNPEGVSEREDIDTGDVVATTVTVPTVDLELIGSNHEARALVDATASIADLQISCFNETSGSGTGGASSGTGINATFDDRIWFESTSVPDGDFTDVKARLVLVGDWTQSEGGTGDVTGTGIRARFTAPRWPALEVDDRPNVASEPKKDSVVFQARVGPAYDFGVRGFLSCTVSAAHFSAGFASLQGDYTALMGIDPVDPTVTVHSESGVPYPWPRGVPAASRSGRGVLVALLVLATLLLGARYGGAEG